MWDRALGDRQPLPSDSSMAARRNQGARVCNPPTFTSSKSNYEHCSILGTCHLIHLLTTDRTAEKSGFDSS
jgi:hypothetical protein